MAKRKKLLFISRSAPYGAGRARALLDMALAASVYEQDIELLFLSDGVYQLLRDQDGGRIGEKTIGNAMEALELYGIEKPLVEAAALEERSLRAEDLVISTVALDAGGIRDLIGKSDVVFNL
ncbi:MAG: sulfurtransferase complex subunit TusC [Gammaproteobacteria bacterium]|nr:sulfurtransferase complex subunit TusC [Gammaproteobacteria bacterium]